MKDRTRKNFENSMPAGVVINAMFGSFLGTLAVLIMDFYRITPVEYSRLTTLMYVAGLGATLFILFFGDSINKIKAFCIAIGCLTITLFLFSAAFPFWGMLIVGAIAGFVFIMIDVTTNAIVFDAFSERKMMLIPRFYSFYDSGTVVGPIFVMLLVTSSEASTFVKPFFALGLAGIVVFILLAITAKKVMPYTPYYRMKKKTVTHGLAVFKSKKAWLIIITGVCLYFVCCGVIIWMPAFANTEFGASFEISGFTVTLFFLTGIIIRFFCPLLFKYISPMRCVFLFGLILVLSTCLIILCASIAVLLLLVAICGACSGMAITCLVLFTSDLFPDYPSTVAAISLVQFNIAGAVSPLLMSLIAEYSGFAMSFLFAGIICAIGIALLGIGLFVERRKGL